MPERRDVQKYTRILPVSAESLLFAIFYTYQSRLVSSLACAVFGQDARLHFRADHNVKLLSFFFSRLTT